VSFEVLGHAESLDFLLAEDRGHLSVGSEILLVVRILKIKMDLKSLTKFYIFNKLY